MKAQTEIMGVALIIVLIILGTLFFVKLSMNAPDDSRKPFRSRELAYSLLSAALESSADCQGQKLRDLLLDCTASQNLVCEDGLGSCDHGAFVFSTMLNRTLGSWGDRYQAKASTPSKPNFFVQSNGDCPGSSTEATFPLQGQYEILTLDLVVC